MHNFCKNMHLVFFAAKHGFESIRIISVNKLDLCLYYKQFLVSAGSETRAEQEAEQEAEQGEWESYLSWGDCHVGLTPSSQ
jgi:hypothetical protein